MIESKVQKPSFVATSYEAGVTTYLSVEPLVANAKVLARIGTITDDEIARLTADGLALLWRHGNYAFLARPEANEVIEVQPEPAFDVSQFKLSPWARWVAVDGVGNVYEYEYMPYIGVHEWMHNSGRSRRIGVVCMACIKWTQTLTAVNQELA